MCTFSKKIVKLIKVSIQRGEKVGTFNLVVISLIYVVGIIDMYLLFKLLTVGKPISTPIGIFKSEEKLDFDIYQELKRLKGPKMILKNVYLPNGKDGTAEIDVVLIHPTGVYAFATKDYSGYIYGRESDMIWNQVFDKEKRKRFHNPIKKSEKHIKALEKTLSLFDNVVYNSVIVFGPRATLQSVEFNRGNVNVLSFNKNLPTFLVSSPIRLTEEEIAQMYNVLRKYSNVPDSVKAKHVEQVNAAIGEAS